ncbi:MAG: hypothetical protein H0W12_10360 [Chitinophagaceae bacterium]|nr:hypothetical protein [Chitinophagaceae bacterium]
MAVNITELIQKNLGLAELQKIDPNTQEVKKPEDILSGQSLDQAALPTVLLGLYKFSGNKEGNAAIINGAFSTQLLDVIFGDKKDYVVEKVARYAGNATGKTEGRMEKIATEAIRVIKENVTDTKSDGAVKTFLLDQKKNILVYLPAELQLGELFDEDAIDDRTTKMEGPLSSRMHWIEKLFPGTDRRKEENF